MASSDPEVIRNVFGILGNALALVLFLAPLPTFYHIRKKGSVEQFSPVPYLATFLNCAMWTLYGLPVVHPDNILIITIDGAGTVIMLAYLLLFLYYSDGKKRLQASAMLFAEFIFIAVVSLLVLLLAHTHERRTMIVGIMCVVFTVGMYVAPLSVMKMVIRTKSVEYMPLPISVGCFLNGICWTGYALVIFDPYITIPNALGVAFSVVQLVLYAVYYRSTQKQIEARKMEMVNMSNEANSQKVEV